MGKLRPLCLVLPLAVSVLAAWPADARHRHHRHHRAHGPDEVSSTIGSASATEAEPGESRRNGSNGRAGWTTYVTPSAATAAEYPSDVFSKKTGAADKGSGEKFQSEDGRAQLTIYDLANEEHDSPKSYLDKHLIVGRDALDYRRVNGRFFAISGTNDGLTFYSRCNFSGGRGTMHCIYIAYPQAETRAWDGVVTRMSLSLRDRQRREARARRSD